MQILDLIGFNELSMMARSNFNFDEPRASKSVPDRVIPSYGWFCEFLRPTIGKPKSLPDRFRRAGCRGTVRFYVRWSDRLEMREILHFSEFFYLSVSILCMVLNDMDCGGTFAAYFSDLDHAVNFWFGMGLSAFFVFKLLEPNYLHPESWALAGISPRPPHSSQQHPSSPSSSSGQIGRGGRKPLLFGSELGEEELNLQVFSWEPWSIFYSSIDPPEERSRRNPPSNVGREPCTFLSLLGSELRYGSLPWFFFAFGAWQWHSHLLRMFSMQWRRLRHWVGQWELGARRKPSFGWGFLRVFFSGIAGNPTCWASSIEPLEIIQEVWGPLILSWGRKVMP